MSAVAFGYSRRSGEDGKIRKKKGVQEGRVGVCCSPT